MLEGLFAGSARSWSASGALSPLPDETSLNPTTPYPAGGGAWYHILWVSILPGVTKGLVARRESLGLTRKV